MILKNGYVSLDGTDVSDKVRSVTPTFSRETHDDSAMGDETRLFESGVKTASLSLELNQDDELDELLDGLLEAGEAIEVIVGRDGNATPKRTGDWIIENYDPGFGQWGSKMVAKLSLKPAGDFVRS